MHNTVRFQKVLKKVFNADFVKKIGWQGFLFVGCSGYNLTGIASQFATQNPGFVIRVGICVAKDA